MTSKDTDQFINVLQSLVKTYNSHVHRMIGVSPTKAEKVGNAAKVRMKQEEVYGKIKRQVSKFKTGQTVRISKLRGQLDRGYDNFLPTNLEISKRQDWEVGVVALGLHLNVKEDFAFDVVQVKSDIVSSGPIGNSTILCVADLPSSKNRNYFYHTLKNVQYYPVQNTSIKSVSIEFLDVSNKVLSLKTGQPSIVLLHLRKTKQTMSYLTNHIRIDSKMDDSTISRCI